MAPSPRRRYSHLPVGLFELLPIPIAKAKPTELLLLLWLYLTPVRKTVPGVIVAGTVALADAIGWSVKATTRCLKQLEDAKLVVVDGPRRNVIWIRRAIADDGPRNVNVLKAWSLCLHEIPACPVVAEIIDAVEIAVEDSDELRRKWRELSSELRNSLRNSSPNSSANSFGIGSRNSRGTPPPIPITDSETASDSASKSASTTDADSTTGKRSAFMGGYTPRVGSGPHGRR